MRSGCASDARFLKLELPYPENLELFSEQKTAAFWQHQISHGSYGQGKSGNLKKLGKVVESHGKWRGSGKMNSAK